MPNKEKEYQRIWSAYTKFIRSQCNKDRVIDSLYFGAFYKSGVDSYCLTGLGKEHVNEFKIAVNQDNVLAGPALAPEDGGKESAVVSFGAISTVAGSTPEATHSFLGRLSDLVTEWSQTHRRLVCLNMRIGVLCFRPNGVVEFKSLAADDVSQGGASIFGDQASDTRSLFRSNKGPAGHIVRGASYAKQLAAQARGSTVGPDQALDQNCLDNFIKDLKSPKTLHARARGGGQ